MKTAVRLAGLLGLIGGIVLWRHATKPRLVVCKPWSEDEAEALKVALARHHAGLDA